ncbi:transporter [Candidatus Neomarinimicrobiota bacterium]
MHLPGNDYFRVTANEQLFLFYQNSEKRPFNISNELRYSIFNYYGYRLGASLEPWVDLQRVTNIISINYRFLNNTFLSIKIPYVKLDGWASNYGLSDIFIGIHYLIKQFPVNNVVISSGVKLPVGYYKYILDTIPLGTGSYDLPILITNSFKINGFDIITDIGYIFNGKSDMLILPQLNKINQDLERLYGTNSFEQNNGDEIVADLAIIKQFEQLVVMLEMNYSYIFHTYLVNADVIWGHNHSKLNITPIILINKLENVKFEIGLSYDLYGKNIFCGYSPIFRIHFSK